MLSLTLTTPHTSLIPHSHVPMFPPQTHSFGLEQMLHHHYHLPPMEQQQQQRCSRWKPSIEVAPNCPRCASTNTKFCYYNNYSLSQPRYFCKGCRRYWTKGGSLRNVPVGGGCRKNRRGKSSSRHHHAQQTSNITSLSDDTESSSVGSLRQTNNNNGSRDIDMALVFAKFLNPKPSDDNNGSSSSNNYLTPESVESENDAVVKPLSDDPVTENFGVDQELSLSGIDELEKLLGVCGDDEDALWSDAATLSSSVATWQPPSLKQMQLHELDLEYSMPFNIIEDHDGDDQLLPINSESAMSDTSWSNWTSFDLSTMGVFSSNP